MKRVLSLLVVLMLVLSVSAVAMAETVEEALSAAASMSNDELYEKAKEEMAAGGQLNFYSTTSFAEKAAANFMNDYPELADKVVYAEIDDGETYTILTSTIGSGVKDSADMALSQNGPDLKTYLLDEELAYSYFPEALKDVVEGAVRRIFGRSGGAPKRKRRAGTGRRRRPHRKNKKDGRSVYDQRTNAPFRSAYAQHGLGRDRFPRGDPGERQGRGHRAFFPDRPRRRPGL